MAETDEPLPCEPEDCAAVLGYLCTRVPEYEHARQANAMDDEQRRAERRRAVFEGFRRARGAMPANESGNGDGNGNENVNANTRATLNTLYGKTAQNSGRASSAGRQNPTPPEAA